MSKALKRAGHEARAAALVAENWPEARGLLGDVLADLAEEIDGESQFRQDWILAGEIAYRIDQGLVLADPIAEALDGVVAHFVALAIIGAWRMARRQTRGRERRLERIKTRLEREDLPASIRRNAERRRKRLERKLSR